MSFLKALLKKGRKTESIGQTAGTQKLESLEKGVVDIPNTGHYVKADRHSVVDSWVFEQNVNNKLVVDKSKSLSLQPNSKLVDPTTIRSPARSKATGVSRGLPNK